MVDSALTSAIEEIVKEIGQPDSVAKKLNAWLKNMSEGDPGIDENTLIFKEVCKSLHVEITDAD